MSRTSLVLALLLAACGSTPPTQTERPRDEPVSEPASSEPGATEPGPAAGGPGCGTSPDDWCAAPAGDPCGAHADTGACRSDDRCEGMPYRGESLVACALDARCFATNCPTVGCVSRCEVLDEAACTAAADRCTWSGTGCARREPCVRR